MDRSVLIIGPDRQAHDLFSPLWIEMQAEKQRFSSTEAALETMQVGGLPSVVLVSYPLWDSSLDDLLMGIERVVADNPPVPVVILASEEVFDDVAPFGAEGITVLSEGQDPKELRRALRILLGAEQRAHPRFIVRMAVRVGAGALLRACQSEDISLSGMLLRTSEEFPVGSEIRLEFALAEDEEPIICSAEVVRYTRPEVENIRGMGVTFLTFMGDGKERLEQFLSP